MNNYQEISEALRANYKVWQFGTLALNSTRKKTKKTQGHSYLKLKKEVIFSEVFEMFN